mgnify:FL=1
MTEDRRRGQRLVAFLQSAECPFVLYAVIIALQYALISTTRNDDVWFAGVFGGSRPTFAAWWGFLGDRWNTWSSRLGIEGLLILLVQVPVLWRILTAAIQLAVYRMLMDLSGCPKSSRISWVIFAVCFIYPLPILYEAGAIATTLNYLWPFAAGLFPVVPVVRRFFGRKTGTARCLSSIPFLIFACFQEILCALLCIVFLAALLWQWFAERSISVYAGGCLAVCVAMVVLILVCPGNAARTAQETATWLPAYAEVTGLFAKLELGFSSMAKYLFLSFNPFVSLFCLALALSVQFGDNKILHHLIGWVPFVFTTVFGLVGERTGSLFGAVAWLRASVGELGTGFSVKAPLTMLPDLLFALVLACILLALHFVIRDPKRYWFCFFLLALGAASRMALGFSPTVWASGERTCTFLYICMSVVLGMLLARLTDRTAAAAPDMPDTETSGGAA